MKNPQKKISFPVKFETKPDKPIELKAFLFSQKGSLLESVNVSAEQASFKTPFTNLDDVRILIAPSKEGVEDVTSPEELAARYKAYEPVMSISKRGTLELLPIPEIFLNRWFYRRCRVRGKVTKRFYINDLWEDKGLCRVRVHICEVDRIRWIIEKIPDYVIKIIPDLVLYPELPVPVPIPEPDPFPQPRPGPDPLPDFSGSFRQPKEKLFLKQEALTSAKRISVSEELSAKLITRNIDTIRDTIVSNFELFHPIFCYIPWLWPYFYRYDELTTVYTDINGNFDTYIYYNVFGDHPDLYFWVEALINGVWTTVYKPGIACNTHWNYECGSHVSIRVTDPRVQWECSDVIPGQIVWVKTIGHGTSVHHIQQDNSTGNPIQGQSINRIGLTDTFEGSGNYRRPFGTALTFTVQFSSGLPNNAYRYYRWSYRKTHNADLSLAFGAWKTLNNPVDKAYTYEYTDIFGHVHFDVKYFKLGPFNVGPSNDLYRIPPDSPTESPVNATETNAHWDQNTYSITFDSTLDGDGLYEFKLELFNNGGNKVLNIPNQVFQIPHYNTFFPSVNAPSQYLINSGGGNCDAYRIRMRIDNSKSQAEIYKVKVDGIEVNPTCCGFVKYFPGSVIELAYRAYHPNNFADFSFAVQKGTCSDSAQTAATNASGMVLAGANGYSRNFASIFSKTFTPDALLGICTSEGKAAFAEYLYVNALAINGNNEINAFDSSALAAFALEP